MMGRRQTRTVRSGRGGVAVWCAGALVHPAWSGGRGKALHAGEGLGEGCEQGGAPV